MLQFADDNFYLSAFLEWKELLFLQNQEVQEQYNEVHGGMVKNSRIKPTSLEKLRQIVEQDYGIILSDTETEQFGFSLLKITRIAMGAFNRAEEKRSMAST